jgi:putative addiction module CopG family antidote
MTTEVTVRLAGRWAEYLQALVADRRFDSIDHALEESLRLLEAFEDREERLARLLDEGERSGDAGSWSLDAFLTECRERDGGRKAA